MERRGSITGGMRQAGEDFRARFAVAQLDPLRAPDWSRLRERGASRFKADEPGMRIERARETVWRAIQAVGGPVSPAGSCLWHVVGWEQSLKEWALEQGWSGRGKPETASPPSAEMHFRANVIEDWIRCHWLCDYKSDVCPVKAGMFSGDKPAGVSEPVV
jgi:hypothetical protein